SGRLDHRPQGIPHVLAHLAQIFNRQTNRDVRDQPDQAADSVSSGNILHHVLPELHYLCAVSQFEFVRKSPRQPPVDSPCEIHSVTIARFTRIVRTSSWRRSHSASSTRLPRFVSR